MKYLLLLGFISSFYRTQLAAQKFVDPENTWVVEDWHYNLTLGRQFSNTTVYRFEDTIQQGGKVYHQLFSFEELHSNSKEFEGLYREDDNGVIYSWDGREESLVMDQAIEVGDTLVLGGNYYKVVTSIDSVQLDDESKRKRIFFDLCTDRDSYWVQGMGFVNGMYRSVCVTDGSVSINCFYKNGELLYSDQSRECGADFPIDQRFTGQLINYKNRWRSNFENFLPPRRETEIWYKFQDEVSHNGKTYARLFSSYDTGPFGDFHESSQLFREDEKGNVFMTRYQNSDEEILHYQSLSGINLGDSINFANRRARVVELDTVEIFDWKKSERRRVELEIDTELPTVTYVEGIGSLRFTFDPVAAMTSRGIIDANEDLWCYYSERALLYAQSWTLGRCITLGLEESIELIGKLNNFEVVLEWAHETRDDILYTIEWSRDVENWEDIGNTVGLSHSHFQFTDSDPIKGVNYYRIIGITSSDEKIYSNIISVNYSPHSEITIYPNPTSGELNISGIESGTYRIYDAVGSICMEDSCAGESIDISNLVAGVYFIEIVEHNQNRTILKFIKS